MTPEERTLMISLAKKVDELAQDIALLKNPLIQQGLSWNVTLNTPPHLQKETGDQFMAQLKKLIEAYQVVSLSVTYKKP